GGASAPLAAPGPDELVIALDVGQGASFGKLVEPLHVPDQAVRAAALGIYDLARIRPDRELQVSFVDGAEAPVAVRYQLDEDRQLVVSQTDGGWAAGIEATPYTSRTVQVGIDVRGSLWASLLGAGLRPIDFARLSEIFRYVVDFNSEVHEGDRFVLVAELRSQEGRDDRLGTIYAARYVGQGEQVDAIRFERPDPAGPPGSVEVAWMRPDGVSLVRAFLRSPLEFFEVTSDFSKRRFHPLLHVSRAHTGTDLGAPYGTPVRSVADGVVVRAGYNGGHGNYVEIRHDDTWTTSYSHLSRISVRQGQSVHQADRVGNVGATGLASGPHLHFQMWRDGRFVDPMRVDLPLQKTLDAKERPVFDALVERWRPLLDAPEVHGVVDASEG
ncbi:MAG TPA: M23 family metallopeptidase, partial [Myxococcota bacterium]|nr:M23 family metallopeptidase [Myxococcota bacterium]